MKKAINWFVARFDSECEECGATIYEGDEAAFVGWRGEIHCENCAGADE